MEALLSNIWDLVQWIWINARWVVVASITFYLLVNLWRRAVQRAEGGLNTNIAIYFVAIILTIIELLLIYVALYMAFVKSPTLGVKVGIDWAVQGQKELDKVLSDPSYPDQPTSQPTSLPAIVDTPIPTNSIAATPTPIATLGSQSQSSGCRETYIVKQGDWLSKIATLKGIALQALKDANNIPDVNRIDIGMALCIP